MLILSVVVGVTSVIAAAYLFFGKVQKNSVWRKGVEEELVWREKALTGGFRRLHDLTAEEYRKTPTDEIEDLQKHIYRMGTLIKMQMAAILPDPTIWPYDTTYGFWIITAVQMRLLSWRYTRVMTALEKARWSGDIFSFNTCSNSRAEMWTRFNDGLSGMKLGWCSRHSDPPVKAAAQRTGEMNND